MKFFALSAFALVLLVTLSTSTAEKRSPAEVFGCNCSSIACMCCVNLDLPIISESACAKMVWFQKDYAIDVKAVIAGHMLFDERFNATHSERCLHVPVLGDTCFGMSNATFSNIGACGIFSMKFKYIFTNYEIPFGDFTFGRTAGLPCPKKTVMKQTSMSQVSDLII